MNPLSKEEFLEKLKTDKEFNKKYGRKHITEGKQVLPPCHYGFQVYTRELSEQERGDLYVNKTNSNRDELMKQTYSSDEWISLFNEHNIPTRAISLMWNQRSADAFLGVPFNIASYGLLLEIIAKEVNMIPDELIGNLGDTHLYSNHIEQAKEQIGRELTSEERMDWWFKNHKPNRDVCDHVDEESPYDKGVYLDSAGVPKRTREPYPLPILRIKQHPMDEPSPLIKPQYWHPEDFVIENYQSHPAIKAPLSN